MKIRCLFNFILLGISVPMIFSGCATISMTEMETASAQASLLDQTTLQKESSIYIKKTKALGLASPLSGFEFVTQLLLRGSDTIVSGEERYREHDTETLSTRILTDSDDLVSALNTLTQKAQAELTSSSPILRKDVFAFESAVIATDEVRRTFEKCVELDENLNSTPIATAIESLKESADSARIVADDLAAAYSGQDADTGF